MSSRTHFRFQGEREKHHVEGCLDHDDVHEEVQERISNPFDFRGEDSYEVINVMMDYKQEILHCHNMTAVLHILCCVEAAMAHCLQDGSQTTEERISLLQTIYHEVLKDIPMDYFLDDVEETSATSCPLTCEITKSLLRIVDVITSSTVFAPFVGSFENHIEAIGSGQYSCEEYYIISYVHNISAFVKEIYHERRYQQWNIMSEEEVFYVDFPLEMTKPLCSFPKYVVKKIAKDTVEETVLCHVVLFKQFSRLPEEAQHE